MTQQAAENLTLYNGISDSSIFEISNENLISQSRNFKSENTAGYYTPEPEIFEKIANDLIIPNKYEEKLVNTAYSHINFNEKSTKVTATSKPVRHSFSVLQEWEGFVVSVSKDTFTARLTDLTNPSSMDSEEADIPLNDLDDADQSRIAEGAIFRWVIGYRRSKGGTRERSSRIVLRHLPCWTKRELDKNRQIAIEWERQLNFDENSNPSEKGSD